MAAGAAPPSTPHAVSRQIGMSLSRRLALAEAGGRP